MFLVSSGRGDDLGTMLPDTGTSYVELHILRLTHSHYALSAYSIYKMRRLAPGEERRKSRQPRSKGILQLLVIGEKMNCQVISIISFRELPPPLPF